MKWTVIPETNHVKVTKGFRTLILDLKENISWDEFEKISGLSKHALQDYTYGKQRCKPSIKTLKQISQRFSVPAETIQDIIVWDKNLENLSRDASNLTDSIMELNGKKFVDLLKLCRYMKITGPKQSCFFPLKSRIIERKFVEFHYISINGQFNPKHIIVKRLIPFDKHLFQVFGLIQAEGSKYEKNLAFVFTNSSPNSIKFILNYFRTVWAIKEGWKCDITSWNCGSKYDEIRSFWSQELGISENAVKIRKGNLYRQSKFAAEFGVCQLKLFNKAFNSIIMKLLGEIRAYSENNSDHTGSYLTGLFSGDGVIVTHNQKFCYTGLAFNQKSQELDHYHKVLSKIGIDFDKNAIKEKNRRCIIIKNWRAYYKLLRFTDGELFLDESRNNQFIRGILENQYFRPLLRLGKLKNNEITVKLYSDLFNISRRSSLDCLARLVDLNLLSIKQKNPLIFEITNSGHEFLKFVEKLKR